MRMKAAGSSVGRMGLVSVMRCSLSLGDGYWHDSHCRASIGSMGQAYEPTVSVFSVFIGLNSPTDLAHYLG